MIQYLAIFGVLLLVLLSALGLLIAARLLRPARTAPAPTKEGPAEEAPLGVSWSAASVRFYLVTLAFQLLVTGLALIFPTAVVLHEASAESVGAARTGPALTVFLESFAFLAILFLGVVYIWQKCRLGWIGAMEESEEDDA